MYELTYAQWELLGFPDVDAYVVDVLDDGGFVLNIDQTDNDNDGIPDLLEQLAGGDVVLDPSQDVAFG